MALMQGEDLGVAKAHLHPDADGRSLWAASSGHGGRSKVPPVRSLFGAHLPGILTRLNFYGFEISLPSRCARAQ